MKLNKIRIATLAGLLSLGIAGTAMANSNADVQKGRLSLEGLMYDSGAGLTLTGEYGLSDTTAIYFGNAELVTTLGIKMELPESSKEAGLALSVGAILENYNGIAVGLMGHYKVAPDVRFFGDVSVGFIDDWSYTNVGLGMAYNMTKDAAVLGEFRSISDRARLGVGLRFTF